VKPVLSEQIEFHANWLIKIRWIIAIMTMFLIYVVHIINIVELDYSKIIVIIGALFLSNVAFLYHLNSKKIKSQNIDNKANINIQMQIGFDFIILTLLLHLTGSIENPCIIFYVFHMIIAGIILPQKQAYFQAFFAILLFVSLISLEFFEIIPHNPLRQHIALYSTDNILFLLFSVSVFIITSILIVYFTVTVSQRLRIIQTELRSKNALLLQQDKIKNEYVSRVTHNIKGDLSTIASCLTVVDKQIYNFGSQENIDFISKALNRTNLLKTFVDELLNLTKMRLEKRFDVKEFDLNEVLNNVIENAKNLAQEKNICFEFNVLDVPLNMVGLRMSIEEAIFNIVHNAIKYTPENGFVKISVKKLFGKINISIKDTGYGISNEDIPKIFDEFYRAGNVSSQEGTGLGLALSRTIIERHKGKITVQSEIDKGTEFIISLYLKVKLN